MFRIFNTYKRVVIGISMAFTLIIPVMSVGAQEVGSNIINGSGNATTSTVGAITSTITNTNGAGTQVIGAGAGGPGSGTSNTNVNVNDLAQKQKQNQDQVQGQQQDQVTQQQQKATNEQNVTINSAPSLIQLPGFVPAYQNFTQPYKPDVFINGAGPVRPIEMTYAQAKECSGPAKSDDKRVIKLYYPQWDKVAPAANFSGYVGSVRVEEKDGQWIESVCKAAYKAMEQGADEGVVEFVIRPVNRTWGIGGSASFGGSGMPAAGANPYALAGAVGLGMGISGSYVKGELMLSITGFKSGTVKSARIEEQKEMLKPVSFTTPVPSASAPVIAIQQGQ